VDAIIMDDLAKLEPVRACRQSFYW